MRVPFPSIRTRLGGMPRVPRFAPALPWLLTALAFAIWLTALQSIDLSGMNDLGLIAVLPWQAFAALTLLTVSFCISLRRAPLSVPTLTVHVLMLILMLYGITELLYKVPRFSVAWQHAGFVEYITRTGKVATLLDARFSWPGFFVLSAYLTPNLGYYSAVSLLLWASVVFNLLYFCPLHMIFSAATSDKRLVWLSIWFFYMTNWIGQDYFAPQALAYFVYLVILAILLKWFKMQTSSPELRLGERWQRYGRLSGIANWSLRIFRSSDEPNTPSTPAQRVGLLGIISLLLVLVISSHQLTPFAILISVSLLVGFNRITPRGLPMLILVLITVWISYMTVDYLRGHLATVIGDVGKVQGTVTTTVTKRLDGGELRSVVLYMRAGISLLLWGLAFVGALVRMRHGRYDLTMGLLAIAPFATLFMQSYGGEVMLRIYLLALAPMVFLAAALFFPTPNAGRSLHTTVAVALMSFVFLGTFFFTRYGNERMEYMSPKEVEAVQYLYDVAEPGSLLLATSYNLPWRYRQPDQYYYRNDLEFGDLNEYVSALKGKGDRDGFLIMTRSQRAQNEMFRVIEPGDWDRFREQIYGSGKFRLIYQNEDAEIFVLSEQADRGGK